MNVAGVIREVRRRSGMTQAQLAGRAGTSQATLSAYESARKQPSIATLQRLLAAAGSRLVLDVPVHAPRLAAGELERRARALGDALELAAALPTEHDPDLRYPRLP